MISQFKNNKREHGVSSRSLWTETIIYYLLVKGDTENQFSSRLGMHAKMCYKRRTLCIWVTYPMSNVSTHIYLLKNHQENFSPDMTPFHKKEASGPWTSPWAVVMKCVISGEKCWWCFLKSLWYPLYILPGYTIWRRSVWLHAGVQNMGTAGTSIFFCTPAAGPSINFAAHLKIPSTPLMRDYS